MTALDYSPRLGRPPGPIAYRRPAAILHPSPRQLDVLRVMATGATFRQAAWELGISKGNASNLAGEAYKRLDCDNLVASFVKLGWLRLP